jgi:hypothetical protein
VGGPWLAWNALARALVVGPSRSMRGSVRAEVQDRARETHRPANRRCHGTAPGPGIRVADFLFMEATYSVTPPQVEPHPRWSFGRNCRVISSFSVCSGVRGEQPGSVVGSPRRPSPECLPWGPRLHPRNPVVVPIWPRAWTDRFLLSDAISCPSLAGQPVRRMKPALSWANALLSNGPTVTTTGIQGFSEPAIRP